MRKLKIWQQALFQLGFLLVAIFVTLPIWEYGQMGFDKSIRSRPLDFRIIPKEPSLDSFISVWNHAGQNLTFLGALKNSLLVSGGAALLSVIFGATMAYAFARYRFRGREIGLFALLTGALLPPVAVMTPLFIILTYMKIRTTLLGLALVYTSFSMAFCVWNMRAAFQSISNELEEAAFLDGATPFKAFLRVTLPLAIPSIGVAALVAFLTGYSEFAIAWLFIDKPGNVTLAMALAGMIQANVASYNLLSATSLMMMVPVVVLFLTLQRYLMDRLLIGNIG